jgi:hypothetical protein
VSTDVSEEHIASIFRVEEIGSANQRASRWQCILLAISQKMILLIFLNSNKQDSQTGEMDTWIGCISKGTVVG